MKLYIKNMVCIRCQMVVKAELEKLDIALRKSGLLLMDDRKSILVEKIKLVIIELVHYREEQIRVNLSDHLTLTEIAYQMHYSSVAHLSNQFKKITGLTPSHFKNLKNKRRRTLEDV